MLAAAAVTTMLLAACSPLGTLNALTPSGSYQKSVGIRYGDDPRQQLDVYAPRQSMAGTPVVVFFYGGNWRTGNRGDHEDD